MKVRFLKDVKVDEFLTIAKGRILEAVEHPTSVVVYLKGDCHIIQKDDCEPLTKEEEFIHEISLKTGFDEITIGCFLSNYGNKHVCSPFNSGWCKCYEKCRVLERVVADMIHNESEDQP